MNTRLKNDAAVNRLVDMVVEEVSLVDRAANNRKFLVVKRDQSMDEDTNTEKATGDQTPADDPTDTIGDGSPLGAAIAALESLTSIVEVLGSLGANRADTRLAELARELRDTADQILTQVGDDDPEPPADDASASDTAGGDATSVDDTTVVEGRTKAKGKPAAKPPAKSTAKPAGKKPASADDAPAEEDDNAEEFAAAKTAIGKLAKLFEGLKSSTTPAASSRAATGTSDASDLATTVTKLSESVQALTQSFQAYEQRLGRVEKQFGLPNSAPPAEQVSKSSDEAVGWPLDLNHPMDRQNVDKAVSFHDL